MAAPLVAGAAAAYLGEHPEATPAQVAAALTGAATTGWIARADLMADTPNRLLQMKGLLQK